jgi:hypothetical protein
VLKDKIEKIKSFFLKKETKAIKKAIEMTMIKFNIKIK